MNLVEPLFIAAAAGAVGPVSAFSQEPTQKRPPHSPGAPAAQAEAHEATDAPLAMRQRTPAATSQSPGSQPSDATFRQLFGHISDAQPAPAADRGNQPGPTTAGGALDRDTFLDRYARWLGERHSELAALPGAERRPIALGLLQQLQGILMDLPQGLYPDLQTLRHHPPGDSECQITVLQSCPPQLIGVVRKIIAFLERRRSGQTAGDNPEGLPDGAAGFDWNTQLGVPQYRTQSDNLAGPETTCSVTSMAMAMERLGYGRPAVMAAVNRQLRRLYFQEQQPKLGREPTAAELASLSLPADYFTSKAKEYLEEENKRPKVKGSSYPRPRSVTLTDEQISTLSEEYEGESQMEDLLDFLRYLHDRDQTASQHWGDREAFLGDSNRILDDIAPDDEDRPRMTEHQRGSLTWAQVRVRMDRCLRDGGAVMLSLYHKGSKSNLTHIITVQSVSADGLVVDDPYGAINTGYDRRTEEDAFAPEKSILRTDDYRNKIDREAKGSEDIDGIGDDWKVEYAQNLQRNESLGESHAVPNAVFEHAWNYVRLLERPSVTRSRHAQAARGAASAQAVVSGTVGVAQQGLQQALGSMY